MEDDHQPMRVSALVPVALPAPVLVLPVVVLLVLCACHRSEPRSRPSESGHRAEPVTSDRAPGPEAGDERGEPAGPDPAIPEPERAAPAAEPMTMNSLESARKLAEKLAGPGASVYVWDKASVPGLHAFRIRPPASGPGKTDQDDWSGVVIVAGKDTWLQGKDAMRAVVERERQDALILARFALFLLERSLTEPVTDPGALGANASQAGPPAITGNTLEYWSLQGAPQRVLARTRVNLRTLDMERASAATVAAEAEGPLATFRKRLAGTSRNVHRAAIRELADQCKSVPGASELLLETMASHGSAFARTEAGKAVVQCHEPSAVSTLVRILESDADENVRMYAAEALGAIGDASVRAALVKARDSDPSRKVTGAAKRALGKLGQ